MINKTLHKKSDDFVQIIIFKYTAFVVEGIKSNSQVRKFKNHYIN